VEVTAAEAMRRSPELRETMVFVDWRLEALKLALQLLYLTVLLAGRWPVSARAYANTLNAVSWGCSSPTMSRRSYSFNTADPELLQRVPTGISLRVLGRRD
jgi:hypothetical protein